MIVLCQEMSEQKKNKLVFYFVLPKKDWPLDVLLKELISKGHAKVAFAVSLCYSIMDDTPPLETDYDGDLPEEVSNLLFESLHDYAYNFVGKELVQK